MIGAGTGALPVDGALRDRVRWITQEGAAAWLHPGAMRELPIELTTRPFTAREARIAGVSARQLQGSRVTQVFHDVYIPSSLPVTVPLLAQAVSLVLPPGAAVGGTTAAWLHGADVRRAGDLGVDVIVEREDQMRRRGVRARSALLADDDVVWLFGVPVISPVRTAFDFARDRDLVEAVVRVDGMLNRGGCGLEALRAYVRCHPAWRGVRWAEETLRFVDSGSESPMETRQRMALVLRGLPVPETQIELTQRGTVVARLDMGYRPYQIGLDYDGEPHADSWQRDAERQQWIRDQSWWHRRYNVLHYRAGWSQMLREVRAALVQRGWQPGDLPGPPPPNRQRLRSPYRAA